MQIFIKEFESFLFLKGLQPVTVQGHLSGLKRIINQITPDRFDEFVVGLYKSNYSYSHKSSSVRTIEYYLEFTGHPKRYPRQRKPKPLFKETLSESEINCLMLSCKNIRERSILSLLSYSGVRPKELCQIRVSDLDVINKTLFVNLGKGLKDGFVEISGRCIKVLTEYLSVYSNGNDDFLFQTIDGRQYNQRALRKLIKTITRRSVINKRVYPYLFRHSFATNMINRGAHILYVKQQLRHSYLETTMKYIHSNINGDSNERFLPQYI